MGVWVDRRRTYHGTREERETDKTVDLSRLGAEECLGCVRREFRVLQVGLVRAWPLHNPQFQSR